MDYQWYPGHMTKARRMMQEDVRLVDLVIELVDARVPLSSRNPDIDELGQNKARLVLLNKADLADEKQNEAWAAWFRGKNITVGQINARSGGGMKQVQTMIREACAEKTERDRKRGILNRPVRAMVAGIPNVGKSTFINTLAGKACTKTGNRPGVTKGKQWIRLNKNVELLDTPGILWPRFEDQSVGQRLAAVGSIRDEVLQAEELALWLIAFMEKEYPAVLTERYLKQTAVPDILPAQENSWNDLEKPDILQENAYLKEIQTLERIAVSRGCLQKGGQPDLERAGALVIEDFRSGRLGRMTLERPAQNADKESETSQKRKQ